MSSLRPLTWKKFSIYSNFSSPKIVSSTTEYSWLLASAKVSIIYLKRASILINYIFVRKFICPKFFKLILTRTRLSSFKIPKRLTVSWLRSIFCFTFIHKNHCYYFIIIMICNKNNLFFCSYDTDFHILEEDVWKIEKKIIKTINFLIINWLNWSLPIILLGSVIIFSFFPY